MKIKTNLCCTQIMLSYIYHFQSVVEDKKLEKLEFNFTLYLRNLCGPDIA